MLYHSNADDGYVPNLNGLAEEVTTAVTMIGKVRDRFDGIVVTGMSGVIPGSPVSLRLDVPLVVVRKKDDSRHAPEETINGPRVTPGSRWLFLDDFVSGGSTRSRVLGAIERLGGTVVGQYLTRDNTLHFYADETPVPKGDEGVPF